MKKILLFLFLFVSFSSHSERKEVTSIITGHKYFSACGLSVGSTFEQEHPETCDDPPADSDGTTYSNCYISPSGTRVKAVCRSSHDGGRLVYGYGRISAKPCPENERLPSKSWPYAKYGHMPTVCLQNCVYIADYSVCNDDTGMCESKFLAVGKSCASDGISGKPGDGSGGDGSGGDGSGGDGSGGDGSGGDGSGGDGSGGDGSGGDGSGGDGSGGDGSGGDGSGGDGSGGDGSGGDGSGGDGSGGDGSGGDGSGGDGSGGDGSGGDGSGGDGSGGGGSGGNGSGTGTGNGDVVDAISDLKKQLNKQLSSMQDDSKKANVETADFHKTINETLAEMNNISRDGIDSIEQLFNRNTNQIIKSTNSLKGSIDVSNSKLDSLKKTNSTGFKDVGDSIDEGFSKLEKTLGEEFGELGELNKEGFDGILESLEELNKPKEIEIVDDHLVTRLYQQSELDLLDSQIKGLEKEYKGIISDFQNYFKFNDGLSSGQYNPHTLTLSVRGNVISKDNLALSTLVDNADLISYIVLFMFGLAGIYIILRST